MGDTAKRQDRAQFRQRGNPRLQKLPAMSHLARGRPVGRRHAAHGIGDHAVDKLQGIWRGGVVMPSRKPDLEQGAVEQLTGIVSEEGAPGAIGTLQSRREPDDEEPRSLGVRRREPRR